MQRAAYAEGNQSSEIPDRPTLSDPRSEVEVTETTRIIQLQVDSSTISSGRDILVTASNTSTTVNNYFVVPPEFSELQQKIVDWLSESPNYHAIQKDTYERAALGTGEWFLQSPIFENWIAKDNGTLWGTGIPGAGKTYLASIIINHLEKLFISRSNDNPTTTLKPEIVAFVYCRYHDKLTSGRILIALLRQLVEQNTGIAQYVESNLYKPCSQKGTTPSQTEVQAVLKHVVASFSQTFIVVDALDELSDEVCHELVEVLTSFDCHLLMTSRDIHLEGFSDRDFRIRAPSSDFEIFVKRELKRYPKIASLLKGKTEVTEDIVNQIERKSDGMFLLAALQLAALKGITTIKSLRTTIAQLPSTLNDMYKLTLKRIIDQTPEESSLALRAILWATHATRSLNVDEFLVAVSIDLASSEFDGLDPEAIPDESTILAVCCGLITFSKEDRTVRLVHFTTQDFFALGHTGTIQDPHKYAASACAIYLQGFKIDVELEAYLGGLLLNDDFKMHARSKPFFEYAYWNLGVHLQRLSPRTMEDIPSAVRCFLQSQSLFLFKLGRYEWDYDSGGVSHFGAVYGLCPLIDLSPDGLLKCSTWGRTSLALSCFRGHTAAVAHILNHLSPEPRFVINTKAAGGHSTTHSMTRHKAIHLASDRGHAAVMKLIPDCTNLDIDINATDFDHRTALHLASWNGHADVIRLLLGHPAIIINVEDNFGETALGLAVGNEHLEAVEVLLNFPGVNVNAGSGSMPLYNAALCAHAKFVELLLKSQQIQVNAYSMGCTALHVACLSGKRDIALLLLDFPGIKINAKTTQTFAGMPEGSTALDFAIKHVNWSIIKLLKDRGAVRGYCLKRNRYTRRRPSPLPDNVALAVQRRGPSSRLRM